jgi:hypothetical protein
MSAPQRAAFMYRTKRTMAFVARLALIAAEIQKTV